MFESLSERLTMYSLGQQTGVHRPIIAVSVVDICTHEFSVVFGYARRYGTHRVWEAIDSNNRIAAGRRDVGAGKEGGYGARARLFEIESR